ncbi:MAG: transporter substrate-binding domain-containing protein [Deinococcota bacterium]
MQHEVFLVGLLIALTSGMWMLSYAQTETSTIPSTRLRVGYKDTPPFVLPPGTDICPNSADWCGISVDLWRRIAVELDLEYDLVPYGQDELTDMLDAVTAGEIDVAVGALTITSSREELFDFSHSFYSTGLGIASSRRGNWAWLGIAQRVFSLEFVIAIASLVACLLVVSVLIWLFERRHNPEHFSNDAKGIGSGFWWSAVTMTTVGYGDKAPKTVGGRAVALIWMFASLIMISGFTAAIATALTVDSLQASIRGPADLAGLRVGVVAGSSASEVLRRDRLGLQRPRSGLPEALQALADGQVDAVVHDRPLLQYHTNQQFADSLEVIPEVFERQDYGFALVEGSPLREDINRVLLNIINSREWEDIRSAYLGDISN